MLNLKCSLIYEGIKPSSLTDQVLGPTRSANIRSRDECSPQFSQVMNYIFSILSTVLTLIKNNIK